MKRPVVRFGLDGDFAGIGKLDGIANEIDQDLRQAATVTVPWRQFAGKLKLECELLVSRERLKRAADGLSNVLNAIIGEFENELTGLDLGQIEHVIDESEQVFAVGLKAFEYAKHLLGRLAVSAVRHQFGVTQDGVERCAQLVTHIGQKLRFVLARLFKLPALVLDFIEQAHVLNGDRCLVGKSCDQFNLFVRKRPYLRTRQSEYADRDTLAQHRNRKDRSEIA